MSRIKNPVVCTLEGIRVFVYGVGTTSTNRFFFWHVSKWGTLPPIFFVFSLSPSQRPKGVPSATKDTPMWVCLVSCGLPSKLPFKALDFVGWLVVVGGCWFGGWLVWWLFGQSLVCKIHTLLLKMGFRPSDLQKLRRRSRALRATAALNGRGMRTRRRPRNRRTAWVKCFFGLFNPLLVLKGIDRYWKYIFHFFQGSSPNGSHEVPAPGHPLQLRFFVVFRWFRGGVSEFHPLKKQFFRGNLKEDPPLTNPSRSLRPGFGGRSQASPWRLQAIHWFFFFWFLCVCF